MTSAVSMEVVVLVLSVLVLLDIKDFAVSKVRRDKSCQREIECFTVK